MNRKTSWFLWLLLGATLTLRAEAVWQWSAPLGTGRAFLWIPPDCETVRAVVVGQNNMIEQGILEHDHFRRELGRLGVAEIFIAPPFDTWQNATNNDAANAQLNALLKTLAEDSGYGELAQAPLVPIGHSAMASYPWNFAAWNPARTLAILSLHGDAPQTPLTGNGQPNLDWGGHSIDGIPGLMVMGEYEWWEDRLTPALKFRAAHPAAPMAMLAEPGRGHFDYADDLVDYLALFLRKAVEQRLPRKVVPGQPPELKPVDPAHGWLVQRWYLNQARTNQPAPFAKYQGDPREAFWAFDGELALATQNYRANQTGKLPQLLGYVQAGKILPQTDTHNQVSLKFEPLADGLSFHVAATFLAAVEGGSKNPARWTGLPAGSPLGHASGGGPVVISRISGPVAKINADTFCIRYDRINATTDRRNADLWLLAEHPGDDNYKSSVQQALLRMPSFNEGAEQRLTFPPIADVPRGTASVKLAATSDSGRPVSYFVREGPAEIVGDTLVFTRPPPRSQFPVKITVVAWQLGASTAPKFKSAAPVTRELHLTN